MTLGDEFQKTLRNLVIATAALFLFLAALSGYVIVTTADQSDRLAAAIETTNGALCSLRSDLERRVETSEEFLRDNPEGVPGIPARVIQTGIDNQQRTINALSSLDCGSLNLKALRRQL